MKSSIPVFLLAALVSSSNVLASSQILFGGKEAHGGIAYVCRDSAKNITFARLLDLWEGENLKTWKSDEAVDAQIDRAFLRMKNISRETEEQIRSDLKFIRAKTYFTKNLLTSTTDALPPYQAAAGCLYEQVARYEKVLIETGESGLKISREIFDSPLFSNSDRAALYLHEAVYSRDRDNNDAENSNRTRIVIAHLFSESTLPNPVRLTILALSGVMSKVDYDHEVSPLYHTTILALRDPTRVNLKLTFDIRTGKEKSLEQLYGDRTSLYRCNIKDMDAKVIAETKWLKISALTGKTLKGEGEPTVLPMSLVNDENDGYNGWFYSVECEKKTAGGAITEVPFAAETKIVGDVECLYVQKDGTANSTSGERCGFTTESFKWNGGRSHLGTATIRIAPAL